LSSVLNVDVCLAAGVTHVAPGDPVMAMVGERADEETIARLRRELRLDQPLYKQFGYYVGGVSRGDLGRSYITNRPIQQDIRERFPKTLQLAGAAMLLAASIGITLGILSALRYAADQRPAQGVLLSVFLGLAFLTRPDTLVLAVPIFAYAFFAARKSEHGPSLYFLLALVGAGRSA
jgi:ABC-type dipeptide/oligopeptide/nickel transport system permease component